jgi:hypothetical protein
MHKKPDQLSLDLSVPSVPSVQPAAPPSILPNEKPHAVVYSLGKHRQAKISQEASVHFSAILNLVSHFKR